MPTGGLRCREITVCPGGVPVLHRLSLEVAPGRRTVLVGPSGAGKTTLMRAVAGLEGLHGGSIELGGRSLAGIPSHRRRIALVFGQPRLLPHLDVTDNVAFPLRAARIGRRPRRARAAELLEEVGLAGLTGRRVTDLSSGEAQRVALARALCADPELLMLDEPLAALDPNRRESLRGLIARLQHQRGLTTLVITHDRAEAAELGERVALLLDGHLLQHDQPRALFERPASLAVARFFGAHNLLAGPVAGGLIDLGEARAPAPGPDGPATLVIRPEDIRLGPGGPLRMRVTESVYAGTHVRLTLRAGELTLTAHAPAAEAPAAGAILAVDLPPDRLWRIPDQHPADRPAGIDTTS
jgi:ABC-type Fe3+/spermidine/putrescine transport system ATPase subunit